MKYVMITGGSKGIGKATLEYFRQKEWRGINLSRTPCEIPGVINIAVDLADEASLSKVSQHLKTVLETAERISLIHNAVFYKPDQLDSLSIEDLHRSLQTNVIASVQLNQICLPFMKNGSSIIYIGSSLSVKGVPGNASYIISKHAVVGLMKATCQDLIAKQIHTCCVCPGLVETNLLRDTMDERTIQFLLENVVIGKRLIQPVEMASLIYVCATTELINGSVIQANLGQVAD